MKIPDYHNPQFVPESALNKSLGERFLLREEVGADHVDRKCTLWLPSAGEWSSVINGSGGFGTKDTYKTTLPLPPEYRDEEIDWKSPEKQADVRKMWAENPAMECAEDCISHGELEIDELSISHEVKDEDVAMERRHANAVSEED